MSSSANRASTIFRREERTAIHRQLERLLDSPYFRHSRRFPAFLRFVVEQTLLGRTDFLKERTLGVEVFGKSGDYDTISDPIVRVTAAEIRKRIAQYYQAPGHESELRISLRPGSYIPQFDWPRKEPEAGLLTSDAAPPTNLPVQIETLAKPRFRFSPPALLIVLFLIFALCAAVTAFLWRSRDSAFNAFWGSILGTSNPVLLCVADQSQYSTIHMHDAADPSHQLILNRTLTAIVTDDIDPIMRLAGALQSHGKKYSLRGDSAVGLNDLQNAPTVFVGAFDNIWTLRLTKPLRYHFANDAEMNELSIVDSNNPSRTNWVINRVQQMATNDYRDFALIARFTDRDTGQFSVVAAGIGRGGTMVASEFLTDPSGLAQLARLIQAAGGKKNMEVILSAEVINGEPGSPKIEASYFW